MRRRRFTSGDYSARHKRRIVQEETEQSLRYIRGIIDERLSRRVSKVVGSNNEVESKEAVHTVEIPSANEPLLIVNVQKEIVYTDQEHRFPGMELVGDSNTNLNLPLLRENAEPILKCEDDIVADEAGRSCIDDEAIFQLDSMEDEYRYSDFEDEGFVDDDGNENSMNERWNEIFQTIKEENNVNLNNRRNNITIPSQRRIHPIKSEAEIISDQLKYVLPRWKNNANVDLNSLTKLLHHLREDVPLLKLPLDGRTLMKTPRFTVTHAIGGGEYHHFGLKSCLEKIIAELKRKGIKSDKIELLINVDGAPVGKSSTKDLWPILCSDKIIKKVYIIGVFYGESKPEDANEFLQYFVNDAIEHVNKGLSVDDLHYHVTIDGIICDAPAKAYILGVKYHSGYFSCTKCNIKGVYIAKKGICFPGENFTPRTDEEFKQYAYMKEKGNAETDSTEPDGYQVKKTILTTIPKLGLVTQVPLDPMHLAFLGCVRKQIYIWMFSDTKKRLPLRIINNMSHSLLAIKDHVPYEFARKPRPLKDIKNFKATELRQIGLYTGVLAFKGHLSSEVYKNFTTFHVTTSIFSNPLLAKQIEWVDYGERLSKRWVKTFRKLYGKKYVSHNIHNFEHMADDVRRYGELENFSAFRFENAIAQMKKLIRSGYRPLAQLASRVKEIEILQDDTQPKSVTDSLKQPHNRGPLTNNFENVVQYNMAHFKDFKLNCSDDKNNYVLIGTATVVRVLNIIYSDYDGETYVIGELLNIIKPLYTYPCSSSKLGINVVEKVSSANLYYWNVKKISAKLFKMPCGENLAVFPILHTLRDPNYD